MLKGLQAYADEAAAIQAVYTSPATMLGRVALGEARRTHLLQQLEGAAPVELETAARLPFRPWPNGCWARSGSA